MGIVDFFVLGTVSWRRVSNKTIIKIFNFGLLLEKTVHYSKRCSKTADVSTFHTDAQHCTRHQIHAPQLPVSQISRVYWHHACEMVRPVQLLKDGSPRPRQQEDHSPLSTTKQELQRFRSGDDMVPRSVGRPRGAEALLCLVVLCICRLTFLELRCVCSVVQ